MKNSRLFPLDLRTKWLFVYTLMVMLVAGIMALGLYLRLRNDQREALHERLSDIANFSAPQVDGDFHALIRTPEDTASSFYKVVAVRLESIRDTSTVITRIYTLREDDEGKWVYVVDVDAEQPKQIGDPYLRQSSALAGGLSMIGGVVTEEDIYHEAEASYLSAYAPIYDQFQNLDGVLGIDIDASPVISNEKKARQTALLAFVATVPLSVLAGYWLVTYLTLPVKDLMRGAMRVSQGNLDEQVPIRSSDELGVLATAFNNMTRQLNQTMRGLEYELIEHKQAEKVQDAIYRISQAAISNRSMDGLYHSIHRILGELMPVDNFFIALSNSDTAMIRFPYYIDQYDAAPEEVDAGHGLTAYVLRKGLPVLVRSENFDQLVETGEVDLVGTKPVDWMGAPLKVEGEIIGVMASQVYSHDVRFTEDDLALFEFVSTQVGLAIDRKRSETELQTSNERYQNLFEESPISLWEEDFSYVKNALDALQEQGVSNMQDYLAENPAFVAECAAKVRILDVNKASLQLFGAKRKMDLLDNLSMVFGPESYQDFQHELVSLASGQTEYKGEGVNHTLDGRRIEVSLYWSAVPGFSHNLSRVIVSMVDITERRQVEQRIHYLGTHDAMTGLYNRAHFDAEMSRLEVSGVFPVSIIVADLDKLKRINDSNGHAAGDELLREAAKILRMSFRNEDVVARIGGDEFGVLLPNTSPENAAIAVERIRKNLCDNLSLDGGQRLDLSLGVGTAHHADDLFDVFKQADSNMYEDKQKKTDARER